VADLLLRWVELHLVGGRFLLQGGHHHSCRGRVLSVGAISQLWEAESSLLDRVSSSREYFIVAGLDYCVGAKLFPG
jgi:hypothetical protein